MVATVTSYSADDLTELLGLELSGTPELIGAVRRGLPSHGASVGHQWRPLGGQPCFICQNWQRLRSSLQP